MDREAFATATYNLWFHVIISACMRYADVQLSLIYMRTRTYVRIRILRWMRAACASLVLALHSNSTAHSPHELSSPAVKGPGKILSHADIHSCDNHC